MKDIMYGRSTPFAVVLAAAIVVLAPGCQADRREDLLILRDGNMRQGRLDSCSVQACVIGGSPVPRPFIVFIGLNGVQPPAPQAQDPAHGEIVLADGSVHRNRLSRIDATDVIAVEALYPRNRVSWIYLPPHDDRVPPDDPGTTEKRDPPRGGGGTSARAQPPWFGPSSQCETVATTATSWGVAYAYDAKGKSVGSLPEGKVTCGLNFEICGDYFFKQKVIETGRETCPESLHFSSVPPTYVCCAEWNNAKQSRNPCDPLLDADCDGVPNDVDDRPLDPNRT